MAAIQFIQAHAVVMSAAVVAILDLIFALIPSVASNGVAHWIYLTLKGIAQPAVEAPKAQ
jgi:hypothetical protein